MLKNEKRNRYNCKSKFITTELSNWNWNFSRFFFLTLKQKFYYSHFSSMTVRNVDFQTETSSTHLRPLLNSYTKTKNELQPKSIDWCSHEWNQGRIKEPCHIKRESFMTIVNTQKPLTIVAKNTILDAVALLDPSQGCSFRFIKCLCRTSLHI